jgi:uridine kinase
MSADTPARLALLRELRDEILLHYGSGRPAVAVDGLDRVATGRFADDLAATFAERGHAVVRASLDGFRRTGGADAASTPAGFGDRYDVDAFRAELVTPFRSGGDTGFQLATVDDDGRPLESPLATTEPDAVLLVDGAFLLQPALIGTWNYSIFLEVPLDVVAERTASDPNAPSEDERRAYVAQVRPRTRAVAIVDGADADGPVRRYADSC